MNIDTPYRGTIRRAPAGDRGPGWMLEIPLLFTRVGTGPTGLLDIVLVELKVDDVSYDLCQALSLHSLDHVIIEGDRRSSIAGDMIRKRPVPFRPDDQDNNALVAVMHTTTDDDRAVADPPKRSRLPVSVRMQLLFTNLSSVTIEVRGEARTGDGTITLERPPQRVTSAVLTTTNLAALGCVVGLLLLWNVWLNSDVYGQTPFARQLVPALLGSLVTFLGLSVGRIKGWLATLVDTLSVLKFPELHFNPSLTRSLSTRWSSIGIGLIVAASGGLMGWFWSQEAPQGPDSVALYDADKKTIVRNERVYRRDLRAEPPRFGWVCIDDEERPPSDPFILGYYRGSENGADDEVTFGIIERRVFAAETSVPMPTKLTGRGWLAAEARQDRLPSLMRAILCDSSFTEPQVKPDPSGKGTFVVRPTKSETRYQEFEVSREWIWEPDQIYSAESTDSFLAYASTSPIYAALADFPGYKFPEFFEQREALLAQLDGRLRAFFAERDSANAPSRVPIATVIAVTKRLLKDVDDGKSQKKTMERAVLIRSLWRASNDRQERDATGADLVEVAWSIERLLGSDLGGKVDRTLFELLLELQVQNERTNVLHLAATEPWRLKPWKDRLPKIYDYLIHSLDMEATNEPQFSFFKELWPDLTRSGAELADALQERDATRPDDGDPTIDFAALRPRLYDLEQRIVEADTPLLPDTPQNSNQSAPTPARTP